MSLNKFYICSKITLVSFNETDDGTKEELLILVFSFSVHAIVVGNMTISNSEI